MFDNCKHFLKGEVYSVMKNMEEENYRFKEQYTTDTVRNTDKVLDIIYFKIEENQSIFDEKFDTVFRSKEIIE